MRKRLLIAAAGLALFALIWVGGVILSNIGVDYSLGR